MVFFLLNHVTSVLSPGLKSMYIEEPTSQFRLIFLTAPIFSLLKKENIDVISVLNDKPTNLSNKTCNEIKILNDCHVYDLSTRNVSEAVDGVYSYLINDKLTTSPPYIFYTGNSDGVILLYVVLDEGAFSQIFSSYDSEKDYIKTVIQYIIKNKLTSNISDLSLLIHSFVDVIDLNRTVGRSINVDGTLDKKNIVTKCLKLLPATR